jgi:hypothetical protein
MSKAIQGFRLIVVALAICVPGAQAQGTGQAAGQPNVPSATPPLTESGNPIGMQEAGTAGQEPVRTTLYNPPLSGAGDFTPGGSPVTRSFLLPAMSFFQKVDTRPFTTVQPGSPLALSSIAGSLALQRNSGRSELTLNYLGGGTVAGRQGLPNAGPSLNSIIQELEATQTVNWRRWTLLTSDQFSYTPESSFGSFLGGLSSFGSGMGAALGEGLPGLRSFLTPNQTILTGRGGRVSNTFLAQGEYHLTARSSITIAGAYGFLRFFDSDLLNSNSAMFTTGYNHQITRADTVAVIYRLNAFRFGGLNRTTDGHVVQLAYGRRITGRLTFWLNAGPELGLFRSPGIASQRSLLWNLESELRYGVGRTDLDLFYQHLLTGGAGVLAGAENNLVEAIVNQRLKRMWRGYLALAYANNRSVANAGTSPPTQAVNTWFGWVQLSRPIGRSADLVIGYVVQLQGSDTPLCTGLVCARSLVRHQISLGLNWRHRPIPIG